MAAANWTRRATAVAAGCLILAAAPAPAAARVTVSVQIVYGGIAVGGIGIFIALGGSWEALAGLGDVPDALVEFDGRRVRLGLPLAPLAATAAETGDPATAGGVLLNLVRWRF